MTTKGDGCVTQYLPWIIKSLRLRQSRTMFPAKRMVKKYLYNVHFPLCSLSTCQLEEWAGKPSYWMTFSCDTVSFSESALYLVRSATHIQQPKNIILNVVVSLVFFFIWSLDQPKEGVEGFSTNMLLVNYI